MALDAASSGEADTGSAGATFMFGDQLFEKWLPGVAAAGAGSEAAGTSGGEGGSRGDGGGRGAAAAGGREAAGGGEGRGSSPVTDAITMSKAIRTEDSDGILTKLPPPVGNLRKELRVSNAEQTSFQNLIYPKPFFINQ